MSFLDYDEARTTALMRRRLQAQKLPAAFIKTRVDAYVDAVSQLIESVTVAYNLMDEEDPNRETLAACCQSQIDAWADEMTAPPDVPTPSQELQDPEAQPVTLLKRARRPLLDRYFDLNAYPSVADKKALAAHEGATYRQIHVWFQNRRAKARAMNIPLRKCDTSPEMASALLEQELFEDEAEEQLPCNEPLKNETDDMSLPWMQDQPSAVAETPRARLQSEFKTGTALHDSVSRHRPSRRSKPVDIDDLVTAFSAMNVRGSGTKTAIGAEKGYAARTAITYVAPKAPLPSYIPTDQLPYATPMATSDKPALEALAPRKLLGLPKRRPVARRRLASMSSDSSRSSSQSSDRVPSLTYSDSSDTSSSSSPSPESPTRSELLPSPPSPTWVDLPSPSFPIIVSPPGLIAHETSSSLTWREDAGAEGDDEDDSWDRAAQRALLHPSKPRRKTSKQKTARPHSRPSRSRSAAGCARSPAPAPQPALPIATDDLVFNGVTSAVVQDGVERLPSWDELDLSALDVDPATAGELDIQLGTWDSSNATLPASQFDFGPVVTFGDVPSAPVAEVQSEPEREQTVDESPANTDVDDSAWATQLASGWNDASSLINVNNLGFSADFAPSAFDGFIASNWNLEPELEPSSTPSTLFGKSGFEASNTASTAQSATNAIASKPNNASTLGATAPATTFTFGSESTDSTFKFGASTSTASAAATPTPAPTTSSSSSARKSAVPSTPFTFGKPAATQPATQKASSPSSFTFGAQSTATPTFAFSTLRSSSPSISSSSFSCAPSSFAFGAGLPGPFTFGISA